jgi:pre-mRNA-splicing factor CDC5/CEF1
MARFMVAAKYLTLRCSCICRAVQGAAVRKASATPAMRIDALRRDYERTRSEMESQAHRAARLDKKAAILVAGLQQRHSKLTGQLEEVAQQVRCVM